MTQQQPAGGFNWARLSMGSKGLLVTGVLFAIACFLTWVDVSSEVEAITGVDISDIPGYNADTGLNAMGTSPLFGTLALIAALGLVVWEGLIAAGVKVSAGSTSPALVSAIIGWAAAGFGLITFIVALQAVAWGAFLGLLLSLALAYAAYMRFQESKVGTAPPPPAA
jgi:hypothetical protein